MAKTKPPQSAISFNSWLRNHQKDRTPLGDLARFSLKRGWPKSGARELYAIYIGGPDLSIPLMGYRKELYLVFMLAWEDWVGNHKGGY